MRTRWLLTLLLLAGLAGCGVESAGTFPRPDVQGIPALIPVQRIQGLVTLQDAVAAGAVVRVYDLATGQEVPLISAGGQNLISAGGQNLISAGGQNLIVTDKQGRFELLIPQSAVTEVLRVTARTDSATLVNLLGAQGQVLGVAPTAPYRLRQQSLGGTALSLELSPASTAVAKTFSGALRLQLLLPPAEKQAAVAKVMRTANAAYTRVKAALAENPEPASALVAALDEQGEVEDLAAFQQAVERLGVANELGAQVSDIVAETPVLPAEPSKADGTKPVKAVTRADFPLGKVAIDADGRVSVPERERPVQKSAAAEGAAHANNASARNDTPASRSPGGTSSETPKVATSEVPDGAVSETPKDAAPKGSDGSASEKPKDVAPKGSDGAVSETPKDAAPKGSDGAASEKPKDAAPKGSDGAASETPKDTAPVNSNNDSQKDNKNKSDEPKGNKPKD